MRLSLTQAAMIYDAGRQFQGRVYASDRFLDKYSQSAFHRTARSLISLGLFDNSRYQDTDYVLSGVYELTTTGRQEFENIRSRWENHC